MSTKPQRANAVATRRRLLEAAAAAFAAHGHDGTNLTRDILEPAAVSVGSFYHQFEDKTALLAVVVQEAVAAAGLFVRGVQTPDARAPLAVARETFQAMFDIVDHHEDLVRIQLQERNHPDPRVREPLREARESWTAALADNLAALLPESLPVQPEVAAELVTALGIGAVVTYLDLPAADRAAVRAQRIEELSWFSLGGFGALAGIVAGQAPGSGPPRREATS